MNFPSLGLAPMDGITDEPFRLTQCFVSKPDIVFTEFVSAEGIAHNAVRLYDQLLYSPIERPIIGQLFGKDPCSFYTAAIILCHLGFDGLDINMGCPAKNVTQHGSGAALIDKPTVASALINSVKQAIFDYSHGLTNLLDLKLRQKTLQIIQRNLIHSQYTPGTSPYVIPTLSVKTRLGTTTSVVDIWIPFLLTHPLDFISLHGRTLKQAYSGLANWEDIGRAATYAHQAKVPIFGNGDITSRSQAQDYRQRYGVDGILIGRAAMGNPWLFADTTATWTEKFTVMKYQLTQFSQIFPHRRLDSLRRHFLLYTTGHPRAKELRLKICQLTHIDQLLSLEADFTHC